MGGGWMDDWFKRQFQLPLSHRVIANSAAMGEMQGLTFILMIPFTEEKKLPISDMFHKDKNISMLSHFLFFDHYY